MRSKTDTMFTDDPSIQNAKILLVACTKLNQNLQDLRATRSDRSTTNFGDRLSNW